MNFSEYSNAISFYFIKEERGQITVTNNHVHMFACNLLQIIICSPDPTKRNRHLHKHIHITFLRMFSACYRTKERHRFHTKPLTQYRRVLLQCFYILLCRLHCHLTFRLQRYNKNLEYTRLLREKSNLFEFFA